MTDENVARALEWITTEVPRTNPQIEIHVAVIVEALAAYDPERMARCGNTGKQTAGEAVAWLCNGTVWDTEQDARDCWNPGEAPIIPLYAEPRHHADEGASDAVLGAIQEARGWYPTETFPEGGESLDCKSASMARLTCDNIEREFKQRIAALQAGTP